ncbi:MAG TPA: YciI family protein [Candidatus Limnocylindrales bacterium]|nr:YciI family protein [Candidatus Limnocylindrales bacterium]
MKYMLLIYNDPAMRAKMTEADYATEMQAHYAYGSALRSADAAVSSEALYPAESATTVRMRDGQRLVTDGPFAETREHLGGYYLIDVKDLDEAIEWAAKLPASGGSVEIRPVVVFE